MQGFFRIKFKLVLKDFFLNFNLEFLIGYLQAPGIIPGGICEENSQATSEKTY